MRLPASRRRGRTSLTVPAAVAALVACGLAQAQTPAAPATPAPKAAAPAAEPAAPKSAHSVSYNFGVLFGGQLKSNAVSAESINSAEVAAGMKAALAGKATLSEADQAAMQDFVKTSMQHAGDANHRAAAAFLAANGKKPGVVTTASGLQYKVLTPGSGDSPKPTDEVTVNYKGTLLDGTEFDSSYKRGQPATFPLNRVIPGWTEGVGLMKPGAKYQFWIPPQLAYDLRPPPGAPIAPGSMLIFEVELIGAKPAPAAPAAGPGAGGIKPAMPTPKPNPGK
jgi:FKBP-type peptidyl-prolyl cis-trans isomerase FkpA